MTSFLRKWFIIAKESKLPQALFENINKQGRQRLTATTASGLHTRTPVYLQQVNNLPRRSLRLIPAKDWL